MLPHTEYGVEFHLDCKLPVPEVQREHGRNAGLASSPNTPRFKFCENMNFELIVHIRAFIDSNIRLRMVFINEFDEVPGARGTEERSWVMKLNLNPRCA